ncbi:MAG TPA: FCD domain-containing protein [Kiloniellales bacterium]|jgi:GntR family transcriptional repressor for pyruvate dehydrogenase complex|nr:FCD domain-containing protein [Kiloniellales bacterium]
MVRTNEAALPHAGQPEATEAENAAPLFSLRQKRLADQVYEVLLLQIARGAYRVGQRLPSEPQLCNEFGVSRPVVREALARLRLDNIVRSRRGSGSWVEREPSDAIATIAPSGSIAEIVRSYEFRAGVEAEAAALAAQRREGRDLQVLARSIEVLAAALKRNEVGAKADIDFHRAVAVASRNSLFIQTVDMLSNSMRDGITVARRLKQQSNSDRIHQVLDEHEQVLLAIREEDPDRAREAMHRHITASRDRMLGFVTD